MKLHLILYIILLYSINNYSAPVIKSNEVTAIEYLNYLSLNPEMHTFNSEYLNHFNFLKTETIDKFDQFEKESNPSQKLTLFTELKDQLRQFPLNEPSKNLWMKALKNFDSKDPVQIGSMNERDSLFTSTSEAYVTLTDFNLNPDDHVFINGWLMEPSEVKDIRLNKNVEYHVLVLSDTYQPIHLFDKPENFKFERNPLALGTCQKPHFNIPKSDLFNDEVFALFSHHCITSSKNRVLEKDASGNLNLDLMEPIKAQEDIAKINNHKKFYEKPVFWGSVLFGTAVLYLIGSSVLNNYEVSVTF